MDCSPPGSSVHEILQARILEWVVILFSRGSFQPRDWTSVSCIDKWILYHWATCKAPRFLLSVGLFCIQSPDKPEKAMAPHSSTLPGKPHGQRSLVGCSPWGHEESDTTEQLHCHFSLSCIGEGNGDPLQCSCLENPRDGGAWWAAVYGVAQSRTRLKRFSSSSSRNGEGNGTPLQYSCLENPMGRGAW